ncbi:MAG: biotin--[acetyl-CoA-carboxylase] ligase [Chloroflexi bacterium]|nr:biotin--[acetyl-CoA-carboxylase] ligase [Chloroflexota bacterium]
MSQLSASAIAAALTTRRLGRPALFFPSVGSTNDVIHAHATAGAAEGLLAVADEQTAGRGRLDRRWWAPPGSSLLMSLLLRPSIPAVRAGQLTMCLGLAAAEGIEQATGQRPALKWPNDLLLAGRKLGGMLTELRLDGDRLEYAVLGLGVNVNVEFDERRTTNDDGEWSSVVHRWSLTNTATSLSMALNRPVARLPLLVAILARTEVWYDRLLAGESPHEAWAARLDTLGRAVTVTLAAGALAGTATGVNAEGALLVRDEDGQIHAVWAGDVTAVR